jgi:hypothetical protein
MGILLTIGIIMSNQNTSPAIIEPELPPVPEERVIASFGQDQINPAQPVSEDNLSIIKMLLKDTEDDINPYFYPNGPVLAYGKDMNGSIVVWMDESQAPNQTVINEIYQRISVKGKMYNIPHVPCRFILSGQLTLDIAKDTML